MSWCWLLFWKRQYSDTTTDMAAPEIDLPSDDDLGHTSDHPTLFGNKDDSDEEKKPYLEDSTSTSINGPATNLDTSSPIVYHYFTFETDLPSPSTLISANASETSAPPQPDLKRFTSPFEWPESRKKAMIILSCIATMVTAYAAGSYAPASKQMAAYWNVSDVAIIVGITTFCAGFAIAPMVLAPFSEINGRYPVFVGAGILFVICQICCAVTRSFPGMLVARFGVGVGSSVFSTMVGGVVSDLYHAEGRNTPMALFSGAALFGTGMGPLVSGFVAQNTSWRVSQLQKTSRILLSISKTPLLGLDADLV